MGSSSKLVTKLAILALVGIALKRNQHKVQRVALAYIHKLIVFVRKLGLLGKADESHGKKHFHLDKFEEEAPIPNVEKPSEELIAFCSLVRATLEKVEPTYEGVINAIWNFYHLEMYNHHFDGVELVEKVKISSNFSSYIVSAHGVRIDPKAAILYCHGGGYCSGQVKHYLTFLEELSKRSGAKVLGVEYTLVPEASVSESQAQILQAYEFLKNQGATKIIVAGDSAGGGHALGALQKLIKKGEQPLAGVLLSPMCDLSLSGESMDEKHLDLFFPQKEFLGVLAEKAVSVSENKHDAKHPEHSFLFGEFDGLPPLYVCVGTSERLFSDSARLVEKARAANVPVEAEFHHYGVHNYPMLAIFGVPEWVEGMNRLCNFINKALN